MHPVAIIFLVACVGALCLSRGEARLFAVGMLGLFASANLLWLWDAMAWLPLFDLPLAMAAYASLSLNGGGWRLALCVVLVGRLALHLTSEVLPLVIYLHWVNAAFLAALVAISFEGGRGVFLDRVRDFRGLHDLLARAARFR